MNPDEEQISEQKKAFLKAFLKVWKQKKNQAQQNNNQQEIQQNQQPNNELPKSQVFSREEYAKDQFWEERYKEHKGQFDWYVEWPELKHFLEETQLKISKESSILMVGCGNSALSEQMYKDGYYNIVSIDISKTIIDRMQEQAHKKQMNLTYLVMDATKMEFEDKKFDIAFDKGTLDALSCGDDTKNLLLLKEMDRVAKEIIVVSHSSHTKRKNIIEKIFENKKVLETKIKLSGQAQLINIIRTRLKDKPLSYVLKDKEALIQCINEYKTSQKQLKQQQDEEVQEFIIKKNEEQQEQIAQQQEQSELAVEQQEQQQEDTEQKQGDENVNESVNENQEIQQIEQQQEMIEEVQQVNYDPRRQSHCYIYKIL